MANRIKVQGKLQTRAAFEPSTFDDASGSVEVVFTTGARGLRSSWDGPYYEELEVSDAAVDLSRLSNSAPVLNAHGTWSLEDVIGVVDRAWLQGGQGRAKIRFSQRDDVKPIIADVKAGILRHLSVGYSVQKYEQVEQNAEGVPVMRATRWTPAEISFVPMGFDDQAVVRSKGDEQEFTEVEVDTRGAPPHEENSMTEEQKRAAEAKAAEEKRQAELELQAANAAKREAEVRAEAQKIERERVAGLQALVRSHKLGDEFAEKLVKDGTELGKARELVLEQLAERSAKTEVQGHVRVEMGTTEREKLVRAAKSALIYRLGMTDLATRVREKAKVVTGPHMARVAKEFEDIELDGGGEFRGFRAVRLAQLLLERAGVRTDSMSDGEIVGRALDPSRLPDVMLVRAGGEQTASDFSVLLENVMHKQLLGNYALADDTWRLFCGTTTVEDFRSSNRYRTGSFGTLPIVPEGEEFTHAAIPDGLKQTVSVQTYGRMLTLSRQAIVNDDLGAIMDTAGKFGRSSGLSIEAAVYALLNAGSGLGAAFNGQTSFFNDAFGNVNDTGSGLSSAAIDADRVQLSIQKDISSNEYLGLAKFGRLVLLVPVSQGGQARTINKNQWEVPVTGATSSKLQITNNVQGLFREVVDSPRLSGTRRYIFADPGDAAAIMVAFLSGDQTPFLEQKLGWRVDGVEWKLRFDFGAQFFDPKGAVTNAGA